MKARKMPPTASVVSLRGEEACRLADDLGIPVLALAANREGARPVSTAEAREWMARFPVENPRNCTIWLPVATAFA